MIERTRHFVTWALGFREPPADGQVEGDWSMTMRALFQQKLIGHPERLLEAFWNTEITSLCRQVLGQDIAYVADASLIRDFSPEHRSAPARMHFDAHIFGAATRMLTVWIPLNDVGRDSPGLAMSRIPHWPRPLWDELVDAVGPDGAYHPGPDLRRSYGHDEIFALARQEPESPFFEPELTVGDVFIFDHQYIHGTQTGLVNPKRRMSLELRLLPVDEVQRLIRHGSTNAFLQLP